MRRNQACVVDKHWRRGFAKTSKKTGSFAVDARVRRQLDEKINPHLLVSVGGFWGGVGMLKARLLLFVASRAWRGMRAKAP
jgi:hypothetical protein